MQGIEIPIGAPLGQLTKDLKGADAQIKTFEKSANTSLAKAGTAAGKTGKDFTGLSRVIQDLPFGFIGIQNNLTQLLPAAGALGLGISVLTTAITFAQTGFANWTRGLVSTKKAVDDAKLSGDEYIGTLNQVAQGSLRGNEAAAGEITTLKLLFNQYKDSNNSLEVRKQAYKQLQDLYPAYFGNLKFEQDATGATGKAYEQLTKSIIASAKARAFADEISKNSIRNLENESKVQGLTAERDKLKTKELKLQSQIEGQNLLAKQEANILTSDQRKIVNEYITLQAKQIQLQTKINNLNTDSNLLKEKDLQLEKQITAQGAAGLLTGSVGGKAPAKVKILPTQEELKTELSQLLLTIRGEMQGFNFSGILGNLKKETAKAITEGFKEPLIALPQIITDVTNPSSVSQALYTPFEILKDDIQFDLLPALNTSFKTFFDEMLMNGKFSFKSLADSIKNTFLSVLASDATTSLLNLLGAKGQDGGKMKGSGLLGGVFGLLGGKGGEGVATKGIGKLLGTVVPFAGLALGAASVLGGLFKKKKDVPLPAQTTSISTQASGSSFSDFSGGRVVFEISGVNLVGVLNRAGAKLQRFGP